MRAGFNKQGILYDAQMTFRETALNRGEAPDMNDAAVIDEIALRINAILQLDPQIKESVLTFRRIAADSLDHPDVVITAINRINDQPFLSELLDKKKTVPDENKDMIKKNFIENDDVRKAIEKRLTIFKAPVKEVVLPSGM